ncbi:MAG: alpha/beta fold hydrolase [Hyphomicrobiaceae bacterium]
MPIVTTRDNVRLFCKVWGDGRPVVLIHGWPLSADSWDPVANALAQNAFKVVAYDRRGFGRSEQPWSGYDYDALADDLADVMQATGAGQDATIVGFSMGGGEVARYMSRHGGKGVVSAALISSVVPFMARTTDNPDGVPQSTFDGMMQGMLADRPSFMRDFLNSFFGVGVITSPVSNATLDWAWAMCMQAGLRPTLAAAAAFATTDFRPDLSSFRVPTLIVHGDQDQTVPINASARPAAKAIPGANLVEYSGAPHGLFATHTDRLVQDLRAHLRG